ncbi:uncharacterized protein LOC113776512 isoform X4 [Coffea eugenioides]|uniref:uncharacterized protein LOC113776512 isoform X4 n=1 Tax=Coffea eugenioides TaxID=49369 RepID=UPI000F60D0A1|nr:uncharacterized protein LOC113776512 isoform X4 [Coffea eugenioides]
MDIALFSPASLFADPDGDSNDEETKESHQNFVERKHQFPGMELIIREFSFHQLNANLLWPGTFAFAEWLVQNRSWMAGRRVIELGSGTGALAIFLHKSFNLDITTSDYDDPDIEDNIAHNCRFNGIIPVLPHIKHACLLPRPAFLMSWRRRIRKEDESLFFNGCDEAGLEVQHLGTRVYCIVPREVNC